jgi:hypothetical protein
VYRLLGHDGSVLYVGKARCLRSRVASYFLQARDERRLAAALRSEAASFQVVQTTSELGALLEELRQIRALRPRFNVQRCVHRRRAPKGRFVLFLPGETAGAVELLALCDGLVVGRATTNERHRPMRPVWALLRRCLRPELPLRLATEEDRIVATWLRREQSRCNLVDLGRTDGIRHAARLVRGYLADPALFTAKIYLR